MISATSPNQEGVEGTDSRSGLDTHRDIGDTRHVYLLVENRFVLSLQGGTFLGWFATAYISLRNSWVYGPHVGATAVYLVQQQLLPLARACEVMGDLLGVQMSE